MNAEQQINPWSEIVARTWQDEKFKARVIAEPAAVLKEFGIPLPPGVELHVLEDTEQVIHLTLPAKPREGELADSDLERVAGGFRIASGFVDNWRVQR